MFTSPVITGIHSRTICATSIANWRFPAERKLQNFERTEQPLLIFSEVFVSPMTLRNLSRNLHEHIAPGHSPFIVERNHSAHSQAFPP
jgi:hypothetical protein